MSNKRQYVKRRVLCWLVFGLILIVAGRETPEFATLTDDVSNDGVAAKWTQPTAAHGSSLRIISHEAPLFYDHTQPSALIIGRDLLIQAPIGPASGQDLLRLLSLQRK